MERGRGRGRGREREGERKRREKEGERGGEGEGERERERGERKREREGGREKGREGEGKGERERERERRREEDEREREREREDSNQYFCLAISAPYSEPHLTFDLQSCSNSGLVQVIVTGGYPKAEVSWTSDRADNISEKTRIESRIGAGELYTVTSQLNYPHGNGTNYTFTLRNRVLGQEMVRSFAIKGEPINTL